MDDTHALHSHDGSSLYKDAVSRLPLVNFQFLYPLLALFFLAMALSYKTLLGLLATVSYIKKSTPAFPAPLLEERQAATIPDYVSTYGTQPEYSFFVLETHTIAAPLVWLYSGETYFPSDIGTQLVHTKPEINFTVVDGYPTPLTLDNLDSLNALGGKKVYLTSVDDITTNPAWLNGVKPDSTGKTDGATSVAIIVNDRGNGELDAFYTYFYAFNWGGLFLDKDVGDHVGVRFLIPPDLG